ncbi:DUF4097 family beta strand repeat-containing protein [Roseiflexus sp.]|uniref:DUF4097 family beta strand repeat-containing protein n=1 Tax=Roseiflexus sp. TaxID=2562120 RepID=UPI0021DE90F9|nr:DUF4097 family beta strand repeat-containing protein [Roseiflexus sp.]GIV98945.1 MAG: hypothetical protein KatS3mg058_0349 [Roseiflexus sp.]
MDAPNHERYTTRNLSSLPHDAPPSSHLPTEPHYQRRNGALIAGWILLTLGLAWLLVQFAGDLISPGSRTLIDQIVGGRRIEIDAGNADVTIIRWDRPEFRVQVQQVGWSIGDVNAAVRTNGDTVQVAHQSSCWLFCGGLRYEITAPATAEVRVTTISGDVRIKAIEGDTTVSTTSGDVRLDGIGGALTVNTVSGKVTLRYGRVSSARVGTASGDVDLGGINGSLAVTTISGKIKVRDIVGGPVRLQTTSGRVSADGALSSNFDITSVSGDVSVKLPSKTGYLLVLRTVSGDVEAPGAREKDAPREWRATIGDGAYALNIATTSGDIRIKK